MRYRSVVGTWTRDLFQSGVVQWRSSLLPRQQQSVRLGVRDNPDCHVPTSHNTSKILLPTSLYRVLERKHDFFPTRDEIHFSISWDPKSKIYRVHPESSTTRLFRFVFHHEANMQARAPPGKTRSWARAKCPTITPDTTPLADRAPTEATLSKHFIASLQFPPNRALPAFFCGTKERP